MFKAVMVLVPWTVLSLFVGDLFQSSFPRPSIAPVLVGFGMAALGSLLAGRYVRCNVFFLIYGGLCCVLWLPYYIAAVSRSASTGPTYWIFYDALAISLMVACRYAAEWGYELTHPALRAKSQWPPDSEPDKDESTKRE